MESKPLPESKDSDKQLNGIKALVVDDEPDARELLAFILEEQGAEVELANSAQTALHKFESFVPDILISDIGMPAEDGLSLLKKVRQLPQNRGGDVVAIALTCICNRRRLQKVFRCRFSNSFSKTF